MQASTAFLGDRRYQTKLMVKTRLCSLEARASSEPLDPGYFIFQLFFFILRLFLLSSIN